MNPTSTPTTGPTVGPSANPSASPTSVPTTSALPTISASPTSAPITSALPTMENPSASPSSAPTPLPPPALQPTYLGCFRDTGSDRALSIRIPGKMSLDKCISTCYSRGYKYAGRQYTGECYCGNSGYDKHGASNSCNACDSANVGGWKSCVYELFKEITMSPTMNPTSAPTTSALPTMDNPSASPTSVPTISALPTMVNPSSSPSSAPSKLPVSALQPTYLGCFRDTSDRALPVKITGSLSVNQCTSTCYSLGYKYAGRQYKGECYCGNSGYNKHGASNSCNACDSANVGAYKSCVYELFMAPIAPSTPPPSPAPVSLPDGHCAATSGYSGSAYFDYDNQANWKNVNGQTNDKIRFSKFPAHVFDFKLHNQCAMGKQSPINVCDGSSGQRNTYAPCYESHEIFQYGGVWKLSQTDKIQAKIFGSKLRLEYATRTWGPYSTCCGNSPNGYTGWCPLIYGNPERTCGHDLPPLADFPHHWNGYTQINHIDFKFPSEHTICGKRYDAEITYWFVWANRKAAINMAIMVEYGNHNHELEKVILKFEETNRNARKKCTGRVRDLKEQTNFTEASESEFEYTSSNEYSSLNEEASMNTSSWQSNEPLNSQRQLSNDHFNPFSKEIIKTVHFYGYWGTTTEPPCLGAAGNPFRFIAWRIMDKPTQMSVNQLTRLKQALLSNVDGNCKCTSVAKKNSNNQWSVARDLQSNANRNIHKCTSNDYT
eukprot:CAMPEP_0197840358 /NCGR_PEP_ID=MMETSP1437-20131217/45560_1 /TAXON_ID=49252 ORGANISM="Eucampia antarctica, Strain CCMP1452" /NCGR_SAMPLE_ID=MMETSP1437 /ASSEMBLY_ACC=CAM_ASM_001096 /LENGTH=716 /DNA_ID=CAMNT_0043449961 /DNA_START=30 /DNA_END=2180 /DNA_ORIENTATION=-